MDASRLLVTARAACPVEQWCLQPAAVCGLCLAGSDYRPARGAPPHPVRAAADQARQVARRAAKERPAVQRGRRNRRLGRQAERDAARVVGGTVVEGSGQLDSRPNDVLLPGGWRAEVRRRQGAFGLLYRALAQTDWAWWETDRGRLAVLPAPLLEWAVADPPPPWTAKWTTQPLTANRLTTVTRWLLDDTREHPDCLQLVGPPRGWLVVVRVERCPALRQ